MEITSIPYITQENTYSYNLQENYSTNLHTIFQDLDNTLNMDYSSPIKRRRIHDDEFQNPEEDYLISLDEILSSPQQNPKPETPQHTHTSSLSFTQQNPQTTNTNHQNTEPHQSPKLSEGGVSNSGAHQQQRRLWIKDRSKAWWEQCNSPDFPDEEFKKAFRMSKKTFNMICDQLDSVVTKKDTMLRLAIPVRQRVAVCIWRLATGEPLRLVSKRFGLGISTCHKLVLEVCAAIQSVLMPKYVEWPNGDRMNVVKEQFESMCGVPNVGGVIYTTHIPIIAPKMSVSSYFNKRHTERNHKTSYSITVQGVVDTKGVFSDVCIGWPGSMSDDIVLEKSALYKRASRGLLKDVWIVGNSSYPLMDWLLVPYGHTNLTWSQHSFNERIEGSCKVAKEAFMRLKGRWSCLQKRTEVKLQDLPVVLGACCVLHNICEMNGESLDEELRFELFDDEMVDENGVRSVSSMQARDQIAHNLLHHNFGVNTYYS